MYKLDKKDYSKVLPAYESVTNSKPIIFSVIDGNVAGQIYADSCTNPKTALIILEDMFFISGEKNALFCMEVYKLLTEVIFPSMDEKYFDFYCMTTELQTEIEDIFAAKITGRPIRKTFEYCDEAFKNRMNWQALLPEGFAMEPIDAAFALKYKYDKEFWHYSTKRFGMALTKENEVVSECIACFVGGGQAEISVDTKEPFRNQGFTSITSTAFIEQCYSMKLMPNWGCWDFREASIALAKKLGFIEKSSTVVFGLTK